VPLNVDFGLQIDSGEKRSFTDTASVAPMGWFPDGTHLLIQRLVPVDSRGLWKMSTVPLLDVPLGQGWPTALQPSPDGHYLGYVLRLFDANVAMPEDY